MLGPRRAGSYARARTAKRMLVLLVVTPALCYAQNTAPPRIVFKSLRFDEVWTAADRASHWDDAMKLIPLAPSFTLTLGGQLRWREEFVRGFNLTNASDDYGQSRVLIHADLQGGDARALHGRLFTEFRDAQSYGRDLPGGTRASDADRADLQNIFGDIAYGRSWLRFGRQEVELGRGRLVGVPDWSNTRRSMEGVRAMVIHGAIAVDAFAIRPIVVRLDARNLSDSTTRLNALAIGSAPGAAPFTSSLPAMWQLYWIEQSISTPTTTHRLTAGGRAAWTFGGAPPLGRSYGFESEAAVQRGSAGAQLLRAWFWTTEATTQWRGERSASTLAVGLEQASGDRDPTDRQLEAFNTLYASAHSHGGYADVFGRANAREMHVIATWAPLQTLDLRGAWYRFDRLRLEDGAYTKQNTMLRAASGSRERHTGDELDLSGTVSVRRHLQVIIGHAWVLPGAFLRDTPGGAQQERWDYVGTTLTF